MKILAKFFCSLLLLLFITECSLSKDSNNKANAGEAKSVAKPAMFERPVPPAMMTEPRERADFLVMRFWDKFNFRDTMYCHAPEITEQAFADYLSLFPHAAYKKVCESVKKTLDAAEVEAVMYRYFCDRAQHYLYDPNSPIRNDEFYIPFLEHMKTTAALSEVEKIRPAMQLELAYRNRVGSKAIDLKYAMSSGKEGTLYGISSEYLLLMFYNPDCSECRKTSEMLKNSTAVSAALSSGKLKILAIYPDEDLAAWEKYKENIPPSWINGYDKLMQVKDQQLYDLKAIPTLYLLDKKKNVIFKDTSTGEIHEYLEKAQQG